MPIEDELARRGIHLRGKIERAGPCPVCGGTDRFGINTEKQLWNCRGCGKGGDVIDLVQHIDASDFTAACTMLAGERPQAKPNGNGKDHAAAEPEKIATAKFRYDDEAGNLLFASLAPNIRTPTAALSPKTASARRHSTSAGPIPTGQASGSGMSTACRSPEAVGNGHFVVIVEGEAKVDLLRSWNVPATCNAGGAGKWKPEHSAFLQGADVVILPDNDQPGRKHRDVVGASLQGIAASIRVLDLPNLPPKADVKDWATAGGTVEQFHDLIERKAKPWAPHSATSEAGPKAKQQEENAPAVLTSARASSFEMTGIEWLWPDRFAIGKVGLIAGLPDEGKGQVLSDMAARITCGEKWPCDEGAAPQGNVLLLTAEDDISDTVVPRLAAAGANLDRVEIIKMVRLGDRERMFSLVTDLDLLRQKIIEVGDVRLIQIDPISAYLGVGKIDSFRGTDVRGVLTPLVDLAIELRVAIIAVMHFNKKVDVTNALLRISDSLAFAAVARHVYGVIDDAEHERKLFVRAKNNVAISARNKTLAFRFGAHNVGTDRKTGKPICAPHILWDPQHVDVTATEAMQAATDARSAAPRDDAKKFLRDILASGPVAKADVLEAADANSISERTLRRAKTELNIVVRKEGFGTDGKWTWQLPDSSTKPHWSDK